jgi:hypothetical protein
LHRTRLPILLAGAFLLLTAGPVQAEAPPPTPADESACIGLLEATPAGPAAPSNLSSRWAPLPDVPEASGVLLAWQDSAEDETCQVAQRKGLAEAEWQDKLYVSANAESADDRDFEALGEYCYRVFAANERGASVSNETCVEVPEVTVHGLPPGAPPPPYPTLPAGNVAGPSPAAPPASGSGSESATRPGVPPLLAGLVVAAALLAAGAATWGVVAGRRRE